jgi:hypothetical protein
MVSSGHFESWCRWQVKSMKRYPACLGDTSKFGNRVSIFCWFMSAWFTM